MNLTYSRHDAAQKQRTLQLHGSYSEPESMCGEKKTAKAYISVSERSFFFVFLRKY